MRQGRLWTVLAASVTLAGSLVAGAGSASAAPDDEVSCSKGSSTSWQFHSYVSAADGLVLDRATLNGRLAVRSMQVPYVTLRFDVDGTVRSYRAELRPEAVPQEGGVTTQLLPNGFECAGNGTSAKYLISGLPRGVTVTAWQRYRFQDSLRADRCEPTGSVTCARFWPTLEWQTSSLKAVRGVTLLGVDTAQRFDFRPDDAQVGAWMVGEDSPAVRKNIGLRMWPGTDEFSLNAIGRGDTWDNYHQTRKEEVAMPGNLGSPGCGECIHMHWRWDAVTNNQLTRAPGGYQRNKFTSGRPAVLDGSPQTAQITVVREHLDRDETRPRTVSDLVDGESLQGQHPIVYWTTSSSGIKQPNGSFKDATFPKMTEKWPGDQGSIWFSPNP